MTAPAGPPADDDLLRAVRAVWEDVFGVPVPDDADFFDLGGASVEAMSISSRLEARLPVPPRLRLLFVHPALADYVDALRASMAAEAT
jgi:acetoacetyl-CoA synthetase